MKTTYIAAICILLATISGCTLRLSIASIANQYDNLELGLPGECDLVVDREGYALGWSRRTMQARWVTYRLTVGEVASNVVKRSDMFIEDPIIAGGSSTLADYKGSGYDRGHLAPAADMHWSQKTMEESFYMSNMSPLTPELNRRVWADIEEFARHQALEEKSVFIATGPVFIGNEQQTIGKNKVTVPDAFYKVLFDETPPCKMIAFLVQNHDPVQDIAYHVTTVSNIETVTKLCFFKNSCTNQATVELKMTSCLREWHMPIKHARK